MDKNETILPLEYELDSITSILFPHLLLEPGKFSDKIKLAKYIRLLSTKRILLLEPDAMEEPVIIAGLLPEHLETIFLSDTLEKKMTLIKFFQNQSRVLEAMGIANAVGQEEGKKLLAIKEYIERVKNYFK